jgi:hypothetical protein
MTRGDATLRWEARGISPALRTAATVEQHPVLAQALVRLADAVDAYGLYKQQALDALVGVAGCLVAIEREGDGTAAAALLATKQAKNAGVCGDAYWGYGLALQWFWCRKRGDTAGAGAAKRRAGDVTFGSYEPRAIERSWREAVTRQEKRVKLLGEKNPPDLSDVLGAGEALANLLAIEMRATPAQTERAARLRERRLVPALRAWLEAGSAPVPTPPPLPGGKQPASSPSPAAYAVAGESHPFIERYKRTALKKVSFRSSASLLGQLNLAWCLFVLGRANEAQQIADTIPARVDFTPGRGVPEEWLYAYDALVMGVWLRTVRGVADGVEPRRELLRAAPGGCYRVPSEKFLESAEKALAEARAEGRGTRKLNLLHSYVLRGAATSQIDERSTLDRAAVQAVMQSAFEILRGHMAESRPGT